MSFLSILVLFFFYKPETVFNADCSIFEHIQKVYEKKPWKKKKKCRAFIYTGSDLGFSCADADFQKFFRNFCRPFFSKKTGQILNKKATKGVFGHFLKNFDQIALFRLAPLPRPHLKISIY